MELAFTPAKNATKPNPFKIIPLESTRKENGWETEETLERAAVTLRRNGPHGPTLDVYDDDDHDDKLKIGVSSGTELQHVWKSCGQQTQVHCWPSNDQYFANRSARTLLLLSASRQI
jgi:hypothetical protein